jgi:hypothetical protein
MGRIFFSLPLKIRSFEGSIIALRRNLFLVFFVSGQGRSGHLVEDSGRGKFKMYGPRFILSCIVLACIFHISASKSPLSAIASGDDYVRMKVRRLPRAEEIKVQVSWLNSNARILDKTFYFQ